MKSERCKRGGKEIRRFASIFIKGDARRRYVVTSYSKPLIPAFKLRGSTGSKGSKGSTGSGGGFAAF